MHVIEVIPLTVLPPNIPQVLSYYHEAALPKGAVVEISLNNRIANAVVIGSTEIQSQKLFLKKSEFELKKISKVISAEPQVSEYQFKIALWLANHYVAPLGLCVKTVLPPFFGKKKYPLTPSPIPHESTQKQPLWIITRAQQSFPVLKPRLGEEGQILILVPEMPYIEYFQKNIPEPVAIIHSGISNKEYFEIWNRVKSGNQRIIIGTRQALFLPYHNLAQIVIIDPLHEFYKSDLSPKYRTPELAEMIAQWYGAQPILVSNLLGVEGYFKQEKNSILVKDSVEPWPDYEVIDMVGESKRQYVGIFSQDIKDRIGWNIEEGKKILILSGRRGYSGILLCEQCGFTTKCPRCDIPMRIHQGVSPVLVCHRCNTTQPYPQFCANCHSSHIKGVGPAGTQRIFEEIQQLIGLGQLPQVKMLILDSDVTQNQTEEDEVLDAVRSSNPVVLIATQKIFSYVYDHGFDYVVIPNLDSLVSGNDFETTESLWYQLEKLIDFSPKEISIQTYHHKDAVAPVAAHEYDNLYRDELRARELFKYPPFVRIAKLTFSHRFAKAAVDEARTVISKLKMATAHLSCQNQVMITETSPAFLTKEKDRYTYTILLKILPDAPLRELLRYVPSRWLIDLDPRSTT